MEFLQGVISDWISEHPVVSLRVGCIGLGVLSLYSSSYMRKLYVKYKDDADLYSRVPRYSDFTKLKQDLLQTQELAANTQIVVGGIVSSHANTVFPASSGRRVGVAKRVVKYQCFLEKNDDTYDDIEDKVPDITCDSVPFRLVDERGISIRVDSVHEATRFKDFVTHICRNRTPPSEPPQLIRRRVHNGYRVDEFLLLIDSPLAAYGTVSIATDRHNQDIVFIPHELNATIGSLVYGKRFSSRIARFLQLSLWTGGCCLLIYGIYPLVGALAVRVGLMKSF